MIRLVFALMAFSLSAVAAAHHSRANFDPDIVTVVEGTIVDYSWRNPHVYVEIQADDEAGISRKWLVESHSVTGMRRNGWDAKTLQVGEQVTLAGSPDRDADKHFLLMSYVQKADGPRLYAFRNPDAVPVAKQIEPSVDFSGTWSLDMRRFNARLAGGGVPDWDYTEVAQKRVDGFDVEQNPELECLAIGVPRITIYPYGTNFFRDKNSLRIEKEHMNEKRVIWFDKDTEALKNQPASYVGSSYGRFQSERHLVIESWGFLPTRWGNANGVDSSAEKTVVEEYVLSEDGMSMEIKITLTDPVYINEPVVVSGGYIKDENRAFVETPCDPTAASRHLSAE